MLKQVKPNFVNRNLTPCLTLIGTYVCIAGFAVNGLRPLPLHVVGHRDDKAPLAWRAQGPQAR